MIKNDNMTNLEVKIINRIVKDALAAGLTITVYDGEEQVLIKSTDATKIIGAMASTEQDWLIFNREGQKSNWVRLIYGNDQDVISDYSVGPENEAMLAPIFAWIETETKF